MGKGAAIYLRPKYAFYRTFAFGNLNALKGGINIDKWRADGTSIFEG